MSIVTLKLLDEKGIINVGGESRSVYDFVSKTHKEDIGRISLSDVSNVKMGTNTTMDCSKLERILNDLFEFNNYKIDTKLDHLLHGSAVRKLGRFVNMLVKYY